MPELLSVLNSVYHMVIAYLFSFIYQNSRPVYLGFYLILLLVSVGVDWKRLWIKEVAGPFCGHYANLNK